MNPTAVFCNDRDRYYAMLEKADAGTPDGLETWCIYVLQGILDELHKVDRLTDLSYLAENILLPAIAFARERELITVAEARILQIGAQAGIFKASDLSTAMPGMSPAQRTYQIKKLVERKMLLPIKDGARQYTLGFSNSFLLRGIIRALSEKGFISPTLHRPG